jgi:hypothetical protein
MHGSSFHRFVPMMSPDRFLVAYRWVTDDLPIEPERRQENHNSGMTMNEPGVGRRSTPAQNFANVRMRGECLVGSRGLSEAAGFVSLVYR